jgi:hypothetical protein
MTEPGPDDLLRKAVAKIAEAAKLAVDHAPPGDELETAELKVLADDAQKLVDEAGTP